LKFRKFTSQQQRFNSGQANACTGTLGIQHFQIATGKIAELLGIKEEEVLMCSTGVIGVPIQINDLVKNLPNLVSDLNGNNFENAAEAILTTDLTLKKSVNRDDYSR